MLRKCLILMLLVAVLVPLFAGSASGAQGWVVQATPRYIFNGENVTVTVTGVPNSYAFVQLATNGTDDYGNVTLKTIDDKFLQLDDLGVLNTNFTVPIDAQSGIYSVHVVYNGREVANCTFEVVYDHILYLYFVDAENEAEIDRLRGMLGEYGRTTQLLLDREWQVWVMGIGSTATVILIGLFVAVKFKDWLEWRTTISGKTAGFGKLAKEMLHPPPRGDLGPYLKAAGRGRLDWVERIEASEGRLTAQVQEIPDENESEGDGPETERYEEMSGDEIGSRVVRKGLREVPE
ncbi:MAG: hypothetical protein PHG80_10965 [Methanoregulaceae archaeon]|nr:hypothetical protein [Methanoregulaceae archaeon]